SAGLPFIQIVRDVPGVDAERQIVAVICSATPHSHSSSATAEGSAGTTATAGSTRSPGPARPAATSGRPLGNLAESKRLTQTQTQAEVRRSSESIHRNNRLALPEIRDVRIEVPKRSVHDVRRIHGTRSQRRALVENRGTDEILAQHDVIRRTRACDHEGAQPEGVRKTNRSAHKQTVAGIKGRAA